MRIRVENAVSLKPGVFSIEDSPVDGYLRDMLM